MYVITVLCSHEKQNMFQRQLPLVMCLVIIIL